MSNWRRQDIGLEVRAYERDLKETRRAEWATARLVLLALALTGGLVGLDLAHLI